MLDSVNRPATGIVASASASVGQKPRGGVRMNPDGYCIGVPPEGADVSLPAAPIALVPCQIVPLVFVKKCRVPVVAVIGSPGAAVQSASALTVKDVNAALRKHIKPEQITYVSAGDFDAAAKKNAGKK